MTTNPAIDNLNDETHHAWEANAQFWDARMGDEGNDFANLLCWPAVRALLDPQPGHRVLDIACGNGLFSRRLAELGAHVVAFDFSANLIELARARTPSSFSHITYHVLDAANESALLGAFDASVPFDSAICNMALFDIANIEPLFRSLPKLLKPGGVFVFTITHPAFNNASCMHVVEERNNQGVIETVYSVKVSRYLTPFHSRGLAIRGQPEPQVYFDRPLQYYLNLGFQNGFVLDGFEERAFPPGHPQKNPLSWGGNFSEIPPLLAARMRLLGR